MRCCCDCFQLIYDYVCTFRKCEMRQYDFEPLETSADTAEASVNSAQSDDVSEYCSGENINVNGNLRLCSSFVEPDVSTFGPLFASLSCQTSMLFTSFIHRYWHN